MEYQYHSRMRWTEGVNTDHKIELNLDVLFDKILGSRNIEAQLALNENAIRTKIANVVLGEILPSIIHDTGMESDVPGFLEVKGNIKSNNNASVGVPTRRDTQLMVDNRMNISMNLHTSRPVNAIQALHGDRAGVAAEIANSVMKMLKKAVLNVDETRSSINTRYKNNTFIEFDHTVEESSSDFN